MSKLDLRNLDLREARFIVWYRELNADEQEAVDHWLLTGDSSRIAVLRECSERLQRFNYASLSHRDYEFALHRT